MTAFDFSGKRGLALDAEDLAVEAHPYSHPFDVILVPKEEMLQFRDSPVFHALWGNITDNTRIVYV